jgi:hypothetical protein
MMERIGWGSLAIALLVPLAACGDDGVEGTGGGGTGGGDDGGEYEGSATILIVNDEEAALVLDAYGPDGAKTELSLARGQHAVAVVRLHVGSTIDDTRCLAPDVRPAGSDEQVGLLACATEGDTVALVGSVSTARSQLPAAANGGVVVAHITRFDEYGSFFATAPATGELTQLWSITELGTEIARGDGLVFAPQSGDEITYVDASFLDAVVTNPAVPVATYAYADGSGGAPRFGMCTLEPTPKCAEASAPPAP